MHAILLPVVVRVARDATLQSALLDLLAGRRSVSSRGITSCVYVMRALRRDMKHTCTLETFPVRRFTDIG